jgi:hypothetical protein
MYSGILCIIWLFDAWLDDIRNNHLKHYHCNTTTFLRGEIRTLTDEDKIVNGLFNLEKLLVRSEKGSLKLSIMRLDARSSILLTPLEGTWIFTICAIIALSLILTKFNRETIAHYGINNYKFTMDHPFNSLILCPSASIFQQPENTKRKKVISESRVVIFEALLTSECCSSVWTISLSAH